MTKAGGASDKLKANKMLRPKGRLLRFDPPRSALEDVMERWDRLESREHHRIASR